jgi:hypothetical protein
MSGMTSRLSVVAMLMFLVAVTGGCTSFAPVPKADPFPVIVSDRCFWGTLPSHIAFSPESSDVIPASLKDLRGFVERWKREPGIITIVYYPTFIQATEAAGDRLMARRVQRIRTFLSAYGIPEDQVRSESGILQKTLRLGDRQYVELYDSGFGKACIQGIREEFSAWKTRNCLASPRKGSEEECRKIQNLIDYTPY